MSEEQTQELQTSRGIIRQLLELHIGALVIGSDLDLDRLLNQIVETASSVTRSRYAALGVVGDNGLIDLFLTSGISPEEREQMGELPHGHGLLGVLIKEGKPIRIPNIGGGLAQRRLSAQSPTDAHPIGDANSVHGAGDRRPLPYRQG